MQLANNRRLIRMFVERIIEKAFAGETAAARLHQVGLFTLIYMLEGEGEPVTAARLAAMTGLEDAQIIRHIRRLVSRGLVTRTQILNKQSRGRAFALSIKHNAKSRRLLETIDQSVEAQAKRARKPKVRGSRGKKAPPSGGARRPGKS